MDATLPRPGRLWDDAFEEVLLSALREQGGAEPDPDTPFTSYGITSLGILTLGRTLSERYGIPLGAFNERAFRTPRSLWSFVGEHSAVSEEEAPAVAGSGPVVSGEGPAPAGAAVCPLVERFLASARRHPDAVCVIDGATTYRYAELAVQAGALAERIGRGGVVAVLGEREAPTYRGYLAALFAGATVVPLSLDFPPERNAAILAQAGARCVVVADRSDDPPVAAQLAALDGLGLEVVDGLAVPATPAPAALPVAPAVDPDSVAYYIFTSGSTGRPKGAGTTRRSVDAFLDQALATFGAGPGDVFSQCHGLTFDFSVFELWGAWSTGAALLAVPRMRALDPAGTAARYGVTVMACTPSLMASAGAAGNLAPGSMPGMRHVVIGGEPLPVDTVRLVQAAAPNAVVDNVYGPTEATIWVTTHRMAPGDPLPESRIVPIGTPVSGMELRLDDRGELLLAGAQVFGGYLDRELNAVKFTADRDGRRWYRTGDVVERAEGGLLHHRGRLDDQVKIRGYRVETGEIERAASGFLGGARTAVLWESDWAHDAELVLCVEAPEVDEAELRRRLGQVLPGYMVPGRVVAVDAFRLTAHAKLDRAHLLRLVGRG
ncbi:AMP-binding protein [Kitasatospora brasiliensis]|uniref:AMP-binding protein n=1 Tax=Kitasatospora brasiliensis TaxID=3058040 RepID=UPI00292EE06C|nr:AMP-binding protein [Kitasatospora sp. K002]